MRSLPYLTTCLLIAASLSLAGGCASRTVTRPLFPPAADLRVAPKPVLAPEAVSSEAALDQYDVDLEAWGEDGWKAVGRICRWAVENGARLTFACPATGPDRR